MIAAREVPMKTNTTYQNMQSPQDTLLCNFKVGIIFKKDMWNIQYSYITYHIMYVTLRDDDRELVMVPGVNIVTKSCGFIVSNTDIYALGSFFTSSPGKD